MKTNIKFFIILLISSFTIKPLILINLNEPLSPLTYCTMYTDENKIWQNSTRQESLISNFEFVDASAIYYNYNRHIGSSFYDVVFMYSGKSWLKHLPEFSEQMKKLDSYFNDKISKLEKEIKDLRLARKIQQDTLIEEKALELRNKELKKFRS